MFRVVTHVFSGQNSRKEAAQMSPGSGPKAVHVPICGGHLNPFNLARLHLNESAVRTWL